MTPNQLPTNKFFSVTSIAGWAGMQNSVLFLYGDESLPYVEKDSVFYYFGEGNRREYSLIAYGSKDIGEN